MGMKSSAVRSAYIVSARPISALQSCAEPRLWANRLETRRAHAKANIPVTQPSRLGIFPMRIRMFEGTPHELHSACNRPGLERGQGRSRERPFVPPCTGSTLPRPAQHLCRPAPDRQMLGSYQEAADVSMTRIRKIWGWRRRVTPRSEGRRRHPHISCQTDFQFAMQIFNCRWRDVFALYEYTHAHRRHLHSSCQTFCYKFSKPSDA